MSDRESDSKEGTGTVSRGGLALLAGGALLLAGIVGYQALTGGEDEPAAVEDGDSPPTIAQLKERAEADPLNSDAWTELAYAYYETGEFAQAARAYRQAIEGDGENAVLWSALGEARVLASEDDPMPAEAVTAFQRALEIDPSDPRARYFLAVQKDLAGDYNGAIEDWLALLKDTPAGAPWEANLRQTIEQVGKINGVETAERIAAATKDRPAPPQLTAGNAIPGPSRQQIEAAGGIPPGEQREMAEGMVASLDAKLRANPANPDGWVMLMRSRMTLGQQDMASQAYKDAVAANPGQAARLTQEAQALGVPGA